jgi:hypothetical protein
VIGVRSMRSAEPEGGIRFLADRERLMRVRANLRRLLALALSSAALASCSGSGDEVTCIPPPCPLTVVITINVTAAGGGALNGVFLNASGPIGAPVACTSTGAVATCSVAGSGGTYSLLVGAPGFNSSQHTVEVGSQGDTAICLCPIPTPQHLDVVLNPAG